MARDCVRLLLRGLSRAFRRDSSRQVYAGRVDYVHLCAAGIDGPMFIPLIKACVEQNVLLSHCPGVYGVPMAQYVLTCAEGRRPGSAWVLGGLLRWS